MKNLLTTLLMLCSFAAFSQTASTKLKGTIKTMASDARPTVIKWTQISGPSASVIVNPNLLETDVTGLRVGVYVFEFSVTDNYNKTGRDNVTVTVNRDGDAPAVDAGPDQNILLKVALAALGVFVIGLLIFKKK